MSVVDKCLELQLEREIAIHGIVLWTSMGFLMPLGILVMRLSLPQENRSNIFRLRCLFYIHVILQVRVWLTAATSLLILGSSTLIQAYLQVFSVSVATAGAIQSIRSFENTFNNNHQRIGVLLYCLMCIQAIIGLLRPRRWSYRITPCSSSCNISPRSFYCMSEWMNYPAGGQEEEEHGT